MLRATLLLLLAVSGGMLLACGSGTHPAATSHTSALTGTNTSGKPISKSQALAFARDVNLTAADVPGFTVSSEREHETAAERRLERQMLRCVGPAGSRQATAEASSPTFELKRGLLQLGVASQVTVARTPAAAARELAAIRSAQVQACLSHYLGMLFRGQQYPGASVGPVSIASGTPPAPGTAGGFGWRVTATLTIRGIRVSFYLDILGFVYGPSTVALFSTGALRPFPARAEQRLFSMLLTRAKAHSL